MNEKELEKLQSLTDKMESKLHALEDELRVFKEGYLAQKTIIDSLLIDHRALNTSIQNTVLAFGSLKEKVEATNAAMNTMSTYKDGLIEKVQVSATEKMTNFRSLCDSRVEGITFKINSAINQANALVTEYAKHQDDKLIALELKLDLLKNEIKEVSTDISDLRGSISQALIYLVIVLAGWFIKHYFPTLGA